MADFKKAYNKLTTHEGGYVNDPDDNGGETFAGISRKFHSKWKGWRRVDTVKDLVGNDNKQITKDCFADITLMRLVEEFYKDFYWDALRLDEIHSDKVANMLFDTAVNMGIVTSIKLACRAIGIKDEKEMTDELFNKLKDIKRI